MVSVGGVAAYIDYCCRAQLLHAASRRVTSPVCSSPKTSLPHCTMLKNTVLIHHVISLKNQFNQSIFYKTGISKGVEEIV